MFWPLRLKIIEKLTRSQNFIKSRGAIYKCENHSNVFRCKGMFCYQRIMLLKINRFASERDLFTILILFFQMHMFQLWHLKGEIIDDPLQKQLHSQQYGIMTTLTRVTGARHDVIFQTRCFLPRDH